jgi:predicted DNA binding protein
MREFLFTIAFESGNDAVADTLTDHPDLRIRSLACHVTNESLWRVDHATGPTAGLRSLEETYLDPAYCPDCLTSDCGSDLDTQVLDQTDDTRVFYVRWSNAPGCTSVPHLALDTLGTGLLFETRRQGREYRWRVLAPDGANFGDFHVDLQAGIGDHTTVNLQRITDVGSWDSQTETSALLRPEQREAVSAAVDHGYYETPRETTLEILANQLDTPQSTLSYRLRRAEAILAKAVTDGNAT